MSDHNRNANPYVNTPFVPGTGFAPLADPRAWGLTPPYFHMPTANCSCVCTRESVLRAIDDRQLVRVCLDMGGPHVMIWKVRIDQTTLDTPPWDVVVVRSGGADMGVVCMDAAGGMLMALTILED